MKKTTKTSVPAAAVTPPEKVTVPVAVITKSTTMTTASKPVTAVNAPAKSPGPVSSTTIEAKIDVGFGNQLFVRGQGEGLSWDRGIPLECVDSQTWRLVVPAKDKLQIKLLINDSVWAKGEDVVVTPGKRVQLVPAF